MRRIPAIALLALVVSAGATAHAADVGALRDRVAAAQTEAGELAGEIRSTQEQLSVAKQRPMKPPPASGS